LAHKADAGSIVSPARSRRRSKAIQCIWPIANIIRHAYGSASDKPILLRAELKAGGIEITLRDWGNGRCPSRPGKGEPLDPMTPGGLGLVCMHNMMDQVLFTPQPRGMLLTMRRQKPG
jgi:anti-sigma regulatory factor (Ser/Thr protein kinase)